MLSQGVRAMALPGQEGEGTSQPDACHWEWLQQQMLQQAVELEEFFARGLIPRWRLAGALDSSIGPKAKARANSKNWHCQPVLLRMFPLALTLWHWYWRVQTGLVWASSKEMAFLFWLVHTLFALTNVSPPTFSARTPSKSYDEGDAGPGVHRIQDQAVSGKTTLAGHPT